MKVLKRRIDLSGFVPYTGATSNLDMDVYNISANLLYGDGSNLTNLPPTPPAGNDTEIQFNNGGVFGASSNIRTTSVFLSPATIPSGSGTRLLWHSTKGAFRSGQATTNAWDDVNIGTYSAAFGLNTRADSEGSVAFGLNTRASGEGSVAFGNSTTASGKESVCFGRNSSSSGYRSFAFGFNVFATGSYSVAFGANTTTSGAYAASFGSACVASGLSSFCAGVQCQALDNGAVALGRFSIASCEGSFAVSGGIAEGYQSISIGYNNKSNDSYSMSFGTDAQALGQGSIAFSSGKFNGVRVSYPTRYTDNQKTIFMAKYTMDEYDATENISSAGSNFICHPSTTALIKIRGLCKSEDDKHASFEYRIFVEVDDVGNGNIIDEVLLYTHDDYLIIDYIEFYFDGAELVCYIENGINEKVGVIVEYDAIENAFEPPAES